MLPNAKCPGHNTARLVFAGPVPVWAGAGMGKGCTPPKGSTVLDLAGQFAPTVYSIGITIPGMTTRYVRVSWPDHGTPDLDVAEWQSIATALRATRAPIFTGCMGGHGRTGTALAILGHFLRAFPDKGTDPIAHVRSVYCPEAVESTEQVEYVKAITGRETACKGSYKVFKGSTTGPSLCTYKVDGEWCNRDAGHTGPCDTRSRADLIKAGLTGKGKRTEADFYSTSAPSGTVTPLSASSLPATWCHKDTRCNLPAGHGGPCISVLGEAIVPKGNKS